MSDLVTLDTVPDAVIANIIQGVLAAEGIEAFIHGEQATNLEGIADWNSVAFNSTPVMDKLQQLGFTVEFRAAGIPVVSCDWIPENYMLTVDLAAMPLMWRSPRRGRTHREPDNLGLRGHDTQLPVSLD